MIWFDKVNQTNLYSYSFSSTHTVFNKNVATETNMLSTEAVKHLKKWQYEEKLRAKRKKKVWSQIFFTFPFIYFQILPSFFGSVLSAKDVLQKCFTGLKQQVWFYRKYHNVRSVETLFLKAISKILPTVVVIIIIIITIIQQLCKLNVNIAILVILMSDFQSIFSFFIFFFFTKRPY